VSASFPRSCRTISVPWTSAQALTTTATPRLARVRRRIARHQKSGAKTME
jgi:hypothetical protein